jgi:hypothetical protein
VLGTAPAAGNAPKPPASAKVAIGQPTIGGSVGNLASLLIPIHYPIELAGRIAETRVALIGARGKPLHSWDLHERLGIHPSATGYQQMASQVPAPN